MFSVKNVISHALSKIITLAFTALFSVYSFSGGICKNPPDAPEEFTPIVRFAVCSDIHLSGEANDINAKKFKNMFKTCYEYSENHSNYKNLDAVMVCGDMTEWGREIEYKSYSKIVSENVKDGTVMLECMGNHEFIEEREVEGVDAFVNYKKYVNEYTEIHKIINGYHFIGVSYSDKDENFGDKTKWLKEQLDIAVADTGDKPIFVFQHPHPTLTVYGSVNWSEIDIRAVLEKYPQVVDFSGHSHYNPNDPRSVWQGSFTAIGTGALTGLMGNLNYISGDAYGSLDTGAYRIVEADKYGNIRIQLYDCVNNAFFEDSDVYLSDITNQSAHIYTWANMYSLDKAPQFSDDAKITLAVNDKGETIIEIPNAKGYFEAESYYVVVKSGLKTVYAETVLSGYVVATDEKVYVNIGETNGERLAVKVTPVSPYGKLGKPIYKCF